MFFLIPLDRYGFTKKTFWFGYVILFTLMIFYDFVAIAVGTIPWTMSDLVNDLFKSIGILSLWGLVLKRKIIIQRFWQIFSVTDLLLFLWLVINVNQAKWSQYDTSVIIFALGIKALFYFLYYIGMFFYAFDSQHIWNKGHEIERSPADDVL